MFKVFMKGNHIATIKQDDIKSINSYPKNKISIVYIENERTEVLICDTIITI